MATGLGAGTLALVVAGLVAAATPADLGTMRLDAACRRDSSSSTVGGNQCERGSPVHRQGSSSAAAPAVQSASANPTTSTPAPAPLIPAAPVATSLPAQVAAPPGTTRATPRGGGAPSPGGTSLGGTARPAPPVLVNPPAPGAPGSAPFAPAGALWLPLLVVAALIPIVLLGLALANGRRPPTS